MPRLFSLCSWDAHSWSPYHAVKKPTRSTEEPRAEELRPQPTAPTKPALPASPESGTSSLPPGCPARCHTEQRQAVPPEPWPNHNFVGKISDDYCFNPLSLGGLLRSDRGLRRQQESSAAINSNHCKDCRGLKK